MKIAVSVSACLFSMLFSTLCFAENRCDVLLEQAQKTSMLLPRRTILEKAIKLCPSDPEVNFQYAYSLERLRKYDSAIKYYKKAVENDKSKTTAKYFFGLGDVSLMTDKFKDAVTAYEAGLKIDPENKRAMASLEKAKANLMAYETIQKKKQEEKAAKTVTIKISTPYKTEIDIATVEKNLGKYEKNADKITSKYLTELKEKRKIDRNTWQ